MDARLRWAGVHNKMMSVIGPVQSSVCLPLLDREWIGEKL